MFRTAIAALAACAVALPAVAQDDPFKTGPAIADFGPVAQVEGMAAIPADAEFKIRFDTSNPADAGGLNRTLVTAARFLNMHAAAGVPEENVALAVVVHGRAVKDMAAGDDNANAPLIAALKGKGVKMYVCGQSAAYYEVTAADLLPGVEMALSAMTAHALLDAEGYALNPF